MEELIVVTLNTEMSYNVLHSFICQKKTLHGVQMLLTNFWLYQEFIFFKYDASLKTGHVDIEC